MLVELKSKIFVVALVTCVFWRPCHAYCWAAGQNPGFSGPPNVEQVKIDVVRVSWGHVVTKRHCADNFVVKFWPKAAPNSYEITDLIPVDRDSVEITVTPKIYYQFQAVAREDKGIIGGVDWNKSPTVEFKTSTYKVYMTENDAIIGPEGDPVQNPTGFVQNYDPDSLYDNQQLMILGLTVEVFVGLVVVGLIVALIIIGLVYKIISGSRKMVEISDEDLDQESGGIPEDDEIDDPNDAEQHDAPDKGHSNDPDHEAKKSLNPDKNIP